MWIVLFFALICAFDAWLQWSFYRTWLRAFPLPSDTPDDIERKTQMLEKLRR